MYKRQEKLYELRTKAHDYSRFNEQIGKRAKTKADYEKAKASLDEYLSLYGYDSAAEYTQTLSQMKKQLAEAGFAKENMDSALQKKTQFENDNDMDKPDDTKDNVMDEAKDGADDAGNAIKDGAEDVKDGVEDVGDDIKDGVEDAGDMIKDGADDVKDDVKDNTDADKSNE